MTNENKIRITSRILRIFIFTGLISFPIMNITFWIMNSSSILALPDFVLKFIPCNIKTHIPLLSDMSFPDSFPVSYRLLNGAFLGSIGYSFRIIAEALGIILISWIMKMGYVIQEEQKHTV